MQLLFSIIIPTFNRPFLFEETLNSIINQTFEDWEILIVDDGSDYSSLIKIKKIIGGNKKIRFFQRPLKSLKGPSSCRNLGISKSRGKFIMFLDSDDILYKDCLKQRFQTIMLYQEYDFWIFNTRSFCDSTNISNAHNTFPEDDSKNENEYYINKFLNGKSPFTVISTLWRKEELEKLKGFDSSFKIYEDPELHTRALLKGLRVKTDSINKYDTFYRKRKRDNKQNLDNPLIIKNKYKFAKTNIKQIQRYKTDFIKNTLRSFVFPQDNVEYIIKFLHLGLKSGTLKINFVFKAQVLLLYHFLKLQNKENIGYHSIRKWTFD